MKHIRICAMVLGLLAWAAAANAQQLKLVDANGNPVTDAQFIAIAEGNKLVQLPPADANGTVDLSSLAGLENITNKTITVIVDRCDQDPRTRVYYLLPGQIAPENKEHCNRYKAAVIFWDGSRWVNKEGPEAGSPVRLQQGPSGTSVSTGAIGEGTSFFNPGARVSFGVWDALDVPRECVGVSGCTTSNKAFALEPAFLLGFGPVIVTIGAFKTNDVSVTETETSTGSMGTVTSTYTYKWHFNAFEFGAQPNLLEIGWGNHPIIVGPQGGGWAWHINETSSSSSYGSSYGGVAGFWGAHVEVPVFNHVAATFDYKHADLHKNSLTENLNYYGFGVSVSVEKPKALFKIK